MLHILVHIFMPRHKKTCVYLSNFFHEIFIATEIKVIFLR